MENKTVEMVVKDLLLADNRKKKKKLSQFRPSVRLSVCPSIARVDQSKTVEVRIMHVIENVDFHGFWTLRLRHLRK